jgi:peptidoglycan/LPS O-acetylase OafA/YrhL
MFLASLKFQAAKEQPMTQQAKAPMARMTSLDVLRFLSALAVLLFHYLYRGALADKGFLDTGYPELAAYGMYGSYGVTLFFIISGFVISWSAEGRSFAEFFIARFARLYPGFIACMTITFLVILAFGMAPFQTSLAQYLANLTMVSPAFGQPFMDGVYWTIIMEAIFYGWVALAVLSGVFSRWKFQLCAAWLMLCIVNQAYFASRPVEFLFITDFGPFFIAGVLLQHMLARGIRLEAVLLLLASFVQSYQPLFDAQAWMLSNYGTALGDAQIYWTNAAVFGLALAAIAVRNIIPASPWLIALGGLTYPLYLLHHNAGFVFLNHLAPMIGRWEALGLVIAAMLVLSWLVCRFIEQPVRRAMVKTLTSWSQRFNIYLPQVFTRRLPQ